MKKSSSRRSFDFAFTCFLLFGCAACGKGDPLAGSATPLAKEAIPETAIALPEYFGFYAIESGKPPRVPYESHAPRGEGLCEFMDPEHAPLVSPAAEFILFDRKVALGLPAPRMFCCNSDHSFEFVETRTKPVNAKPEMLRIVPASNLSTGRCGVRTEDGTYHIVEIGDQSSLAKRIEEFRKPRAIGLLHGLLGACKDYAKKNGGLFPPNLETLIASGDLIERELESPNDHRPFPKNSYLYVAGQTDRSDGRNVLIYERPEITVARIPNVVFVDGRVEYLDPKALKAAVPETKQHPG